MKKPVTARVARSGRPITQEEREAILAMRRENPAVPIIKIAEVFHRARETVRLVLQIEGLLVPGEKAVPTYGLAKDSSPIKLVGFTDPLRIDWYRRKFGASRILVVPTATSRPEARSSLFDEVAA